MVKIEPKNSLKLMFCHICTFCEILKVIWEVEITISHETRSNELLASLTLYHQSLSLLMTIININDNRMVTSYMFCFLSNNVKYVKPP